MSQTGDTRRTDKDLNFASLTSQVSARESLEAEAAAKLAKGTLATFTSASCTLALTPQTRNQERRALGKHSGARRSQKDWERRQRQRWRRRQGRPRQALLTAEVRG